MSCVLALVNGCLYSRLLSKTQELLILNQKYLCEGLSKSSSYFTLHLIQGWKLKGFKKVSRDLKTILKTDLANLRFLKLCKRRIMLRGKIALLKLTLSEKETVVCEASFYLKNLKFTCLERFSAYLGSSVKTTISVTLQFQSINEITFFYPTVRKQVFDFPLLNILIEDFLKGSLIYFELCYFKQDCEVRG